MSSVIIKIGASSASFRSLKAKHHWTTGISTAGTDTAKTNMAAFYDFESHSKSKLKLKADDVEALLVVPYVSTGNRCANCCTGKGGSKSGAMDDEDTQALLAETRSKVANVSVVCRAPPPGVTIEIEPRTGDANIVICKQVPVIPVVGGDGNGSIGQGGNLREEAFLSGLSSLLLLLFVLALGSTLWYQQKYQRALNENQRTKSADKPKDQ